MINELCDLLGYVSKVALAIHTMSAYRNDPKSTDPYDLLWLSDSLHNFGMLANAIRSNDTEQIISACDRLENYFLAYNSRGATEQMSWKSFPGESFERHHILLQEPIDILRRLKKLSQKDQ